MTTTGMIPARRIRQDDDSRAVIPDLIRNRYYCQKTVDPDFRQDDAFVRACPEFNSGMTATISVIPDLIRNFA